MSACARPLAIASRAKSSSPKLAVSISANAITQICGRRSYAVQSGGAPRFQVFNRKTKWLQKERAASTPDLSRQADYLKDEVARRVAERLLVR